MAYMWMHVYVWLFISWLNHDVVPDHGHRTSIIAASRYFGTLRITLMATMTLRCRSQHSKTLPKVPSPIKLRILSAPHQPCKSTVSPRHNRADRQKMQGHAETQQNLHRKNVQREPMLSPLTKRKWPSCIQQYKSSTRQELIYNISATTNE